MVERAKKKKKKHAKTAGKVTSVVPGQYLGYTTQETVLAHRLLSAPRGSSLSLEVIDDVSVEKPDGSTEAIQAKSALVTNPVSNHSIALWKTLHNWLSLLDSELVEPSAVAFVLYVSKVANAPIGQAFSDADTPERAAEAIESARTTMWGSAPRRAKRGKLPGDLAVHVDAVLEHHLLPHLVINFRLEFGSGSPVNDFEADLASQIMADGVVTQLSQHVQGWVRRRIALALEQQAPAIVLRDEFYTEMSAFLRRMTFLQILESYAKAPTALQQQAELSRVYVRQLQFINLEDDDVLAAVSDFLAAATNRVTWARMGLILEASFDDFDETLRAAWRNHRIKARAQHPAEPIHCGQCLYGDCMVYQTPLQGIVTPADFVRGCFHALAEGLAIGWHPAYERLLKGTVAE